MHDAAALVAKRLVERRREGCRRRHDAFLHLHEKRVAERAAEHQHEIRARADASHADHPMRDIGDVVAIEHHAPLALDGLQISLEPVDHVISFGGIDLRQDRRIFLEAPALARALGDLFEHRRVGAFHCALDRLFDRRFLGRVQIVGASMWSASYERICQRSYALTCASSAIVVRYAADAERTALSRPSASTPFSRAATLMLCREALQVPLPRRGEGLVEIVEIEHDVLARRAEETEVVQVRVAVDHDGVADRRRLREVPGHHRRRAAQERERRRRHARHAQRNQPLLAAGVAGKHPLDGIGPVRRGLPGGVGVEGNGVAQGAAGCAACFGGAAG